MNKHYSPIHSNNFTNHLSMYEQALRRLNIDDKLIKERCLDYVNSRPLRDINDKSISLSKKEEKYLVTLPILCETNPTPRRLS